MRSGRCAIGGSAAQLAGFPPCDRQSLLRMKRVDLPTVHATTGFFPSSDGGPFSDFAFAHQFAPARVAGAFGAGPGAGAAAGFTAAFWSMIFPPASSSSKTKQPDANTQIESNTNPRTTSAISADREGCVSPR